MVARRHAGPRGHIGGPQSSSALGQGNFDAIHRRRHAGAWPGLQTRPFAPKQLQDDVRVLTTLTLADKGWAFVQGHDVVREPSNGSAGDRPGGPVQRGR